MKKIFYFLIILFALANNETNQSKKLPKYYDKNPSKITSEDLKIIKNFDDLSYEIVERKIKPVNIGKIYNFIIKHKKYIHDYSKLKIDITGRAGFGDNSKSIYIEVSYPIFDKKQEKDINNEKLKYNLEILNKVEEYADAIQEIISLKETLEFLRVQQILIKAETKTGIKYRDERIQLLKQIMETKIKLRKAYEKKEVLKIYLLNLTNNPEGLKRLL